jgi:hypothetical protein
VRYSPNTPVFLESYEQIVDNVSWMRGRHDLKIGLDAQLIHDERGADTPLLPFPDIASYLAAKNGSNPFGYTRFEQTSATGR